MLGEQAKKFQHWQSTMKVLLFKSAELILQSRCHPAPPSKCLAFSSPLRHSSAAHPVSVPPKLRAEKDLSKETALVGPLHPSSAFVWRRRWASPRSSDGSECSPSGRTSAVPPIGRSPSRASPSATTSPSTFPFRIISVKRSWKSGASPSPEKRKCRPPHPSSAFFSRASTSTPAHSSANALQSTYAPSPACSRTCRPVASARACPRPPRSPPFCIKRACLQASDSKNSHVPTASS